MTCEEFRLLRRAGTAGATPSLLLAMMRHIRTCRGCFGLCLEAFRRLTPEQVEDDARLAREMTPRIKEAILSDPEV